MSLKALSSRPWDPEDTSLWTMEECATFLKITKSSLYHKVERGEVPCVRFGSRLRFIPSSVRSWIQAQEIRFGT